MCAGKYECDPHAEWALEGWGDDAFDYEQPEIVHSCNEKCPYFCSEVVNGKEETWCGDTGHDVIYQEEGTGDCVW